MSGFIIVLLIWACIAIPVGWAIATIEQKVNHLPEKRLKNALLWSFFGGPIGWIVLMVRSNLKFASDFGANQKIQAEAARQQLQQQPGTSD
jgi:uncharacterized membrane protein YdcZ (DUF606 family)